MEHPIGTEVAYDHNQHVVESYAKGWYTLKDLSGNTVKARGKDLTPWGQGAEEGDEAADASKMSRTLKKYASQYAVGLTIGGKKSRNSGDDVAKALTVEHEGVRVGMSADEVCALADSLFSLEPGTTERKYAHLNPGARRMNAGNRIRAAWRRGELETIKHSDGSLELIRTI